ncbi:rhomboid family intramembrane serine protease [Pseudomonas sp. L1(2025)]|uniref:rhomboid family intramembrane serine protease n=1 Tax=Pseudomonas sp. L1(2025) TaxID=3449429 RepID=UPI003F694AAF
MRFTGAGFSRHTTSSIPWLTLIFVLATVIAYLWQVHILGHYCAFSESELRWLGSNTAPLTFAGEYWRLFSSLFIHASLQSLVASVTALSIIGAALERCVRRWQWLVLYVCGGAFSGLAVDYWSDDLSVFRLYTDGAAVPVSFQRTGAVGAITSLAAGLAAVVYWADLSGAARRLFNNVLTLRLLQASALLVLLMLIVVLLDKGTDYSVYLGAAAFGLLMGTVLVAPGGAFTRAGVLLPIVAVVLACTLVLCMTHNTVKYTAMRAKYVDPGRVKLHERKTLPACI